MESFQECGWAAFGALGVGTLVTLFGVVALAMALIKPRTGMILGIAALGLSLAPVGVGFVGMLWGRQQTDSILMSGVISSEHVDEIRAQGYSEASQCIPVGMTISGLPFLIAGAAVALGAIRKSSEPKA